MIYRNILNQIDNVLQALHGAPLYISETCPSQIRGTLISLKELLIVLGMLVRYVELVKLTPFILTLTVQMFSIMFNISSVGLLCR